MKETIRQEVADDEVDNDDDDGNRMHMDDEATRDIRGGGSPCWPVEGRPACLPPDLPSSLGHTENDGTGTGISLETQDANPPTSTISIDGLVHMRGYNETEGVTMKQKTLPNAIYDGMTQGSHSSPVSYPMVSNHFQPDHTRNVEDMVRANNPTVVQATGVDMVRENQATDITYHRLVNVATHSPVIKTPYECCRH